MATNRVRYIQALLAFTLAMCCSSIPVMAQANKKNYSGIYPHLAFYNDESECGTGAVVPWADRLWVITYGPHLPFGSSDKLYEITNSLDYIVRPESIGGTPAGRMIHEPSNQLFIGPYAIDKSRNIRTIPYTEAPGRYTGFASHLADPAGKIYLATMEEGFYEVDVQTLRTKMLYEDANVKHEKGDDISTNQPGSLLEGAHGKGVYSGQGVMVYSNNGEASPDALKKFDIKSGALAEWDGGNWKVVRRNQFVEVTGPGGIHGNKNPETDPIWTTGWDHRSALVGVRDHGKWSFYRMPKASHSYDGAHGWNTEWPRIRDIGTSANPDYLMTMHGMFWDFPATFSSTNSAGIRPRSAYLKVIGDFARWNNQLVFGCDDSAQKEFLNKRKVKGNIEGPGQSNSNLWFTSITKPDSLGATTATGAVWLNDNVQANSPSEPFLFAGWGKRMAWILNDGESSARFHFEVDRKGDGTWTSLELVTAEPGRTVSLTFAEKQKGEWIRVTSSTATNATVLFTYTDGSRWGNVDEALFSGIADVNTQVRSGGLLYGLPDNRRALGILAGTVTNETFTEKGYYELDGNMNLVRKDDRKTATFVREKFAVPKDVVTIEESSVLVVDDQGRRWRLPRGDSKFDRLTEKALTRICREVATERDLLNLHGTFYELPAENADGFAKVRPISSHNLAIHDYASYRGLLVMTGIDADDNISSEHIVRSSDGVAKVWAGTIDDLWKLGKPTGEGGPWKNADVKTGIPSDPYLIGFYDERSLTLSHDSKTPVVFKIEVEPLGHGPWMTYQSVTVHPGEDYKHRFPDGFEARWIRFSTNEDCKAKAWLKYE